MSKLSFTNRNILFRKKINGAVAQTVSSHWTENPGMSVRVRPVPPYKKICYDRYVYLRTALSDGNSKKGVEYLIIRLLPN